MKNHKTIFMRKLLNRLMSVSLLSLLLMAASGQKAAAQDVTVSYQDFYDELSPYGQWVYDPQYGNVWVPDEDENFRPYGTGGHWVMTDYGNTWVSNDPWGWACYHYGRWTFDPYYGWVWVPGYEWAPAWVSWRYGGGQCGWAPLSPGVSISVTYNCPESWWVFVTPQYMYQDNCIRYWRGPSYNNTYVHQTTIINNYYVDNSTHVRYNYGPRQEQIRQYTHQPVQVYKMEHSNRRGAPSISGNRVSLYRPAVNRSTISQARPTNVIQAPRSIGRPQQAPSPGAGRQPQFRQDVARQPHNGNPGRQPGNTQPGTRQEQPRENRPERQREQPRENRYDQRQDQQRNRPEPQRQEPQRNRPEPQRYEPQRQAPQQNRPEPQRYEPQRQAPQQNRPEPQRYQPPANRPEPQRQAPQQNRPEPQRYEPQRQAPQRYEPQRQAPQQNRPEPQRYQPPQQNRPEPQRQAPQQQPQRQAPPQQQPQRQAPQQQPQRQEPQRQAPEQRHEGGREHGGRR